CLVEDDGDRGQPGVRMADPGSTMTVAARDEDIADGDVALEVADALTVHPQHLLPLRVAHGGGRRVVLRTLHDELRGPPRRDRVVEPGALAPERELDAEVRIRFGDDANRPSGTVRGGAFLPVR